MKLHREMLACCSRLSWYCSSCTEQSWRSQKLRERSEGQKEQFAGEIERRQEYRHDMEMDWHMNTGNGTIRIGKSRVERLLVFAIVPFLLSSTANPWYMQGASPAEG